jgi:hypothetical protein
MKTKKPYRVTVVDHRVMRVYLEAESAEDARQQVEASDDLRADFDTDVYDNGSEWYIDGVERRK